MRKQFGTFGWNSAYEFDEADFFVSVSQLQRFINKTGMVDFKGISVLTEANYGGKINCAGEQLKLETILKNYFNESVIFDPNYEFHATERHSYGIPRKFEHRDMVKHIEEEIPIKPSSFVYGIHPNAQIRSGVDRGRMLVNDLVLTLGRIEDPVTDEKERKLYETVKKFKEYLPDDPIDIVQVKEKFPNDYTECLNMNLLHECIVYNILLGKIRKTLDDLQEAINGKMVYTAELKQIAQEIHRSKLPYTWQLVSYPTMKSIGSYLKDLNERIRWLKQWVDNRIPQSFWLTAFFYPQSFLISCKQNYARRRGIDLSTVNFKHRIQEGSFNGNDQGILTYGMILEGARWDLDEGGLVEQRNKEIHNEIQGIHFIPTETFDDDLLRKTYHTPVYKTELRADHPVYNTFSGNMVTTIELDTKEDPCVWIKRGVAIILQAGE